MDFISQVQEKAQYLNEDKQRLILEIIDNFLPHDDWEDDELTEKDLHYIALSEQEYADGETVSWNDVNWKTPE